MLEIIMRKFTSEIIEVLIINESNGKNPICLFEDRIPERLSVSNEKCTPKV